MIKTPIAVLMALLFCCFISCSDDEETTGEQTPTQQWDLLDSITIGDEAILKMTYDSQRRATSLLTGNGFQNIFGYDSVLFTYPDLQTILVRRTQLGEAINLPRVMRTHHSTFHLNDGLIVSGMMDVFGTQLLKDSMVCEYSEGKLQAQTFYECYDGNAALVYRRSFAWDGQNLSEVTATDPEGQPSCTIRYAYQSEVAKALLPYMSAEYIVDRRNAYLTVLAAMGYFGTVPRNVVREIFIDSANEWQSDYKAQYEIIDHPTLGVQELRTEQWQLYNDTLVSQHSYQYGQVLHWRGKN